MGGKLPRNIAAPHQAKGAGAAAGPAQLSSKGGVMAAPQQVEEHVAEMEPEHVDYRSFTFQQLESPYNVIFENYCGPTPESNWVVPGKLLVGAYPASTDDAETLDLITSILNLGIKKFVCLQQEYRDQGVTEAMWRSGQALRPYFHDVRSIVRKKAMLPYLQGSHVVDEENLSFVHFPIRDCGITNDDHVLELARSLVKAIAEGEIIYLHCWGGHGRTGTLVCIMLHLMYGYDDEQAMFYCQTVHDLRKCPVEVGSPQTETQRQQVRRVIQKLMTQSRFQSRTMSADGDMLATLETLAMPEGQGVGDRSLSSTLNSPRSGSVSSTSLSGTPSKNSSVTDLNTGAAQPSNKVAKQSSDSAVVTETQFAVPTSVPGNTADVINSLDAAPESTTGEQEDLSNMIESPDETRMRLGTADGNDPTLTFDDGSVNIQLASDCEEQDVLDESAANSSGKTTTEDDELGSEYDDNDDQIRPAEEVEVDYAHPPANSKPSFRPLRKTAQ